MHNFSFPHHVYLTLKIIISILISQFLSIQTYAIPTGKPATLVPANGRVITQLNRKGYPVCFFPKINGAIVYPSVDYDSATVCDYAPALYFDIHNRLATKFNNGWMCLTAVDKKIIDTIGFGYMEFKQCVMNDLRQRWRYDKTQDKLVSISNGLTYGETSWTLAQSKYPNGVYPLGGISKYTLDIASWLNKPTAPVNASYPVRLAWKLKENPFQQFDIIMTPTYYNPFNKQIYTQVLTQSPKCLTSIRVRSGSSDSVTWENCDTSVSVAKPEQQWSLTLANHLRDTVRVSDYNHNALIVFNSGYSGVLLGQYKTISVKSPVSTVAPFTGDFELGSDYFNYALAEAKNLMGEVGNGYCPAPGMAVSNAVILGITPRSVSPQVIWRNWLGRLYELSRADSGAIIGSLRGSDIIGMEMITEATLEGHYSDRFLSDPFGILYDTDTPPGTNYSAAQRFYDQRQSVSSRLDRNTISLATTLQSEQQANRLTFDVAIGLLRDNVLRAYNLIAPALITRRQASQQRIEANGLEETHFNELANFIRSLPPQSTFILRTTTFTNLVNLTNTSSFSAIGFVENNGTVRIMPSSTASNPLWSLRQYQMFYENSRVSNGEDILHFLQNFLPSQQRYHAADIYVVNARNPPPPPTTASVGTQTELSAGSCNVTSQTDMSGDGQGFSQSRMNFCLTGSGRCMDR